MKTELVLFGAHFNMAPRARRRFLVVFVYAGFAAMICESWMSDRWHFSSIWIFLLPFWVNRLVLGNYESGGGLVDPFVSKETHPNFAYDPHHPWARLGRWFLQPFTVKRTYTNDERELRQRDSIHLTAYRVLGGLVALAFLTEYLKATDMWELKTRSFSFDQLIYAMLIVSYVVSVTLPQAIVLWTEPDMEEPQ
jgi:hypothetical protein